MKHQLFRWRIAFACALVLSICAGCNSAGVSGGDPVTPGEVLVNREAMDFGDVQTIFGATISAASVDLATIPWLVSWPEEVDWVAAVGIEDPPGNPSYPVVRFLGRRVDDGTPVLGQQFTVDVSPVIPGRDCRLPRIDCLGYRVVEPPEPAEWRVDAVVAYRYSQPGYTWPIIEGGWDIRVTRMTFQYDLEDNTWTLLSQTQLPDGHMQWPYTGQTHPDIAFDVPSGHIYCAWTDLS